MATAPQVKVSVNLPEDLLQELDDLASRRGTRVTRLIRQAISDMIFFESEMQKGSSVLLEDRDRNLRKVQFKR
jgi:metal-responsive CopG/Arc/MetJ family transcriptional regulator